jgi:uncharacterized membrane protein
MVRSGAKGGPSKKPSAEDPGPRPTRLNRLAVWITKRVGTMVFFLIIFTWTVSWLLWNMLAPRHLRFDPFPGFVLWLFISNMIQLFLMPLLLIGQNLLSHGAEERARRDLDVNLKAEKEIRDIKAQLAGILARLEEIKVEKISSVKDR